MRRLKFFAICKKKSEKKELKQQRWQNMKNFGFSRKLRSCKKSEAKERESLDLLLRRNDEFECLFSVLVKKNITYIKKSAIDKKTNFKKPKMMRKWIQQHTTYCTTNYTEQLWSSIDAEINNHCFAWKKICSLLKLDSGLLLILEKQCKNGT